MVQRGTRCNNSGYEQFSCRNVVTGTGKMIWGCHWRGIPVESEGRRRGPLLGTRVGCSLREGITNQTCCWENHVQNIRTLCGIKIFLQNHVVRIDVPVESQTFSFSVVHTRARHQVKWNNKHDHKLAKLFKFGCNTCECNFILPESSFADKWFIIVSWRATCNHLSVNTWKHLNW